MIRLKETIRLSAFGSEGGACVVMENYVGHDSRAVANRLLQIAKQKGCPVTIMQLLKLIFFAHGWSLALLDRPLSKNKAQAWQYGPVFPQVYRALPGSGSKQIDKLIIEKNTGEPYASNFDEDDDSIMSAVVEGYGKAHAYKLSRITHEEGSPWSITFNSQGPYSEIPDSLIKEYFARKLAAQG